MKRKRWLPHPFLSLCLWILWLVLMNSISLGQWLLGGFFAWLIPLVAHPFLPNQPKVRHPGLMLGYLWRFFLDILASNWNVARLLFAGADKMRPAFVEYPVELEDEYALTLLAATITLTPGTVCAHYDEQARCLLIHVLHLEDEDALIEHIRQRYEWALMEIFQC